jgi:peptidoglycan/xylan/chitin deacetylase (PgdA/CDA1 family)
MNLVSFSIRTKGLPNFTRRLWTVFARFGFTEQQIRKALETIVDTLEPYGAGPSFFIPAVVLQRHKRLLADISRRGAEIGIHGYVHNDYRTLGKEAQCAQTQRAISVFQATSIPFQGFRNPYLGWNENALHVFASLGFAYESNEAVLHDVVDIDAMPSFIQDGYKKSLKLFQALPCNMYTVRPHTEGDLLRLPTSIPDDEMLFDRLRITDPKRVGGIWSEVMEQVYRRGGLYALNLHPERGVLCKESLDILLQTAHSQPLPVWIARLDEIARWWRERSEFRLRFSALADDRWQVEATCDVRATLVARHVQLEGQTATAWYGADQRIAAHSCVVRASVCPAIALSQQTAQDVEDFLQEQGYPVVRVSQEDAARYALYVDMPEGLGNARTEQLKQRSVLIEQLEGLDKPLIYFGCWPDGQRAALAISGDIDSVTVQDFFLRILEVAQPK